MAISTALALKLTLAPTLVAIASIAAQRLGPRIAGLLAGFPIVGGPIFMFLVVEHGTAFGVEAATGVLLGLVAWATFSLCYSHVCRVRGWASSALLASAAFLLTALLLSGWRPGLIVSFAAGIAVPALVPILIPPPPRSGARRRLPRFELPVRMAAAAALVLTVSAVAESSGPVLAGLLTSYPVATGVLATFSQRLYGADAAIEVLLGSAAGLYGYVTFFVVAALTLPHGLVIACTAALAAALAVQILIFRFRAIPAPRA